MILNSSLHSSALSVPRLTDLNYCICQTIQNCVHFHFIIILWIFFVAFDNMSLKLLLLIDFGFLKFKTAQSQRRIMQTVHLFERKNVLLFMHSIIHYGFHSEGFLTLLLFQILKKYTFGPKLSMFHNLSQDDWKIVCYTTIKQEH